MNNEKDESINNVLIRFGVNCGQKRENGGDFASNKYFFCDKVEFIKKCANMNTVDMILSKIDIVNYGYEMLNYNLNVNLLLDDIIIRLGDVYEYC